MGNNQISRPETAVLIPVELFPHLAFIFRRNINHQLNFSGQGYRRLFHFKAVFENCFDFEDADRRKEIPDGLPFQVI